jgi:PadR family transcriptional regulator, regulatory protein PadR
MLGSTERFEQIILTAILSLRDDAYGVTIHQKACHLAAPKEILPGAVYIALDRLEDKGFIASWLSDPTPERGNRPKRFYRLEALGERALEESPAPSRGVWEQAWEDLGERVRGRPKWTPDRIR